MAAATSAGEDTSVLRLTLKTNPPQDMSEEGVPFALCEVSCGTPVRSQHIISRLDLCADRQGTQVDRFRATLSSATSHRTRGRSRYQEREGSLGAIVPQHLRHIKTSNS